MTVYRTTIHVPLEIASGDPASVEQLARFIADELALEAEKFDGTSGCGVTALEPTFDPIRPADIGVARQWTRLVLVDQPYEDAQNAALIVSELVTNAFLHGGPRVVLGVHETAGQVEIEVIDSGPRTTPAGGRPEDEHGRGLPLVESLAELTITRTDTGTAVTATMRNHEDNR